MSNQFLPNFKNRNAINLNKRFRSSSLAENGYKNTGKTKTGEWYDWLQQGIVSLFGTGVGTAFLNTYCQKLGFEEEWFHCRKKQQQSILNEIILDSKKEDFKQDLSNWYGLDPAQIEELYKRLQTIDELLEHDLSYSQAKINYQDFSDKVPYGITLNDPMLLIGTDKVYNPILQIFWMNIPKNRNLNTEQFKDHIFKKFNVLINFGGDLITISLNQSALDSLAYSF